MTTFVLVCNDVPLLCVALVIFWTIIFVHFHVGSRIEKGQVLNGMLFRVFSSISRNSLQGKMFNIMQVTKAFSSDLSHFCFELLH